MTAGFAVLSLALVAIWLAGTARGADGRERTRGVAVLLAGMIPWGLVTAAFVSAQTSPDTHTSLWGDIRVSLTALRLAPDTLASSVTIGGRRDAPASADGSAAPPDPDIVVAGAPADLASFTRGAGGAALSVVYGRDETRSGVVAVDGDIVGATPLQDGDVICLDDCSGPKRIAVVFRSGRLAAEGAPGVRLPDLPHRKALKWLPSPVGWAPTSRVFPLRDYGAPQTSHAPGMDPCKGRLLCRRGDQPVQSLLLQSQGLFPAMRVLLLDPGARLERGGAAVARTLSGGQAAQVGAKPVRIEIYSVQYGDPDQALDDPDLAPSYLAARRSFRAAFNATDGLTLTLDTPTSQSLRRADLQEALEDQARLAGVNDPDAGKIRLDVGGPDPVDGGARTAPKLAFDLLGTRFADNAQVRLTLDDPNAPPGSEGFAADVKQAGGHQPRQPFGAAFWVGKGWEAQLRLDRLDPQAGLLALARWVTLAAFLLAVVELERRRASPTRFRIASALDYLLAVRLLVAVGGAYVDGGPRAGQAVGDALSAFIAVPLAFSLAPGEGRPGRWVELLYALFAVLTLWTLRQAGATGGGALAMLVVAGLILAARIPLGGAARSLGDLAVAKARPWADRALGAAASRLARPGTPAKGLPAPLPAWLAKPLEALRSGWRMLPAWSRWLILGAVVVRIGLGLLTFKESVTVGQTRLSLSLLYLPALLAGFAGVLAAARTAPVAENKGATLGFLALLTAATAATPFLIQDNGFIIFALPVALFGWFVHWRRTRDLAWGLETLAGVVALGLFWWVAIGPGGAWLVDLPAFVGWSLAGLGVIVVLAAALRYSRTVLWAAPALAAITLLTVIHLTPRTDAGVVETVAARGDAAAELALLRNYTTQSQNALRLLNVIQPDRVHESGTRSSEQFTAAMAHLERYTAAPGQGEGYEGGGLLGRGFLNLQTPTVLLPFHFNDNVSAIHLIAPFGRLGAVAFLAVLWALAALSTPRALAGGPSGWRAAAGGLALWTIALVATYMILANLQFAPFTGKNVYFLAATSLSDLVEGAVLMALAIAFLGRNDA